jgi:hypothetical protein
MSEPTRLLQPQRQLGRYAVLAALVVEIVMTLLAAWDYFLGHQVPTIESLAWIGLLTIGVPFFAGCHFIYRQRFSRKELLCGILGLFATCVPVVAFIAIGYLTPDWFLAAWTIVPAFLAVVLIIMLLPPRLAD